MQFPVKSHIAINLSHV